MYVHRHLLLLLLFICRQFLVMVLVVVVMVPRTMARTFIFGVWLMEKHVVTHRVLERRQSSGKGAEAPAAIYKLFTLWSGWMALHCLHICTL